MMSSDEVNVKYASNPDKAISLITESMSQSVIEFCCEWDNYLNDGFDIFSINNGLTNKDSITYSVKKAKRELKFDNAMNFSFNEECKNSNTANDEEIIMMLEKEKERLRNEVGSVNSNTDSVSFSFNVDQKEVSFDSNAFKSFKSNKSNKIGKEKDKKLCTVIVEEDINDKKNNENLISNNEVNIEIVCHKKIKDVKGNETQTDTTPMKVDTKCFSIIVNKELKDNEIRNAISLSYYSSNVKKVFEISKEENLNYNSTNVNKNKMIFIKKKIEKSLTNFNTIPLPRPEHSKTPTVNHIPIKEVFSSTSPLTIQKVNDIDFNSPSKKFKIEKVYTYNAYHDIIETHRGSSIDKDNNNSDEMISIANDSKKHYQTMTPLVNMKKLTIQQENYTTNENIIDNNSIDTSNEIDSNSSSQNIPSTKKDKEITRLTKQLNSYKSQNKMITDENKKLLEVISIFKKLSSIEKNALSPIPNASSSNMIDNSNNTLCKISKTINAESNNKNTFELHHEKPKKISRNRELNKAKTSIDKNEMIPFHLMDKKKLYENMIRCADKMSHSKYYASIYSKYVNKNNINEK